MSGISLVINYDLVRPFCFINDTTDTVCSPTTEKTTCTELVDPDDSVEKVLPSTLSRWTMSESCEISSSSTRPRLTKCPSTSPSLLRRVVEGKKTRARFANANVRRD